MNKQQAQVAEFMRDVKGLELPTKPTDIGASNIKLCLALIAEEAQEVHDAICGYNLEATAKELSDLLYVVYYTCNTFGIDIEPIFDEVHRSNMTKKGGAKREDGKQLKPATYEAPQLEPLIKEQMAND